MMKSFFKPKTAFYINLGLAVLNAYFYSQGGGNLQLGIAIFCLVMAGSYFIFPHPEEHEDIKKKGDE